MRVHGSGQIQVVPGIEDERDVARVRPVGRLFESTGRVDGIEIVRGQCATSVELDEIRPRPERDEQRGVGVVGHGANLARGQRSRARHSHAAGMDRAEQRAPPAPLASGDDDYAVARLEAVLTEKLRPSGRLAGDLGVGETFDHAQRVDVRDRVAFAVLDRLEEVNREVRELRRWLALRPLDRPLA